MALHGTTARRIADERLLDAQKNIQKLREYLTLAEKEISHHRETRPGEAFPIIWGDDVMQLALTIHNEIARCNGAAMVQPEEKMIVCERDFGKCNICGALLSNEASSCENGHELGKQYASPS